MSAPGRLDTLANADGRNRAAFYRQTVDKNRCVRQRSKLGFHFGAGVSTFRFEADDPCPVLLVELIEDGGFEDAVHPLPGMLQRFVAPVGTVAGLGDEGPALCE